MKMIVGVFFVATPFAKSEVLFAIVGNDAVGDAIGAKAIEDAVDGGAVDGAVDLVQDLIVAQGGAGVFQG